MRLRVLFFGYPLLEIMATWVMAQVLGWVWTLLILLAGIPIGFYVMRRAGSAAFESVRVAGRSGRLPDGEAGSHSLTFIAGLLIAIPGFCTDLIGLVILLPPVKEFIRRRVARRISAAGLTNTVSFVQAPSDAPTFAQGDLVVGEVVTDVDTQNDDSKSANQSQAKRSGPSIEGPV
ncbi:MAG: FxsA family protein [Candidatus Nanopelagicales bacterium]|nr:FxsA family protein [Candidatus Nanopelagicales bacterium]